MRAASRWKRPSATKTIASLSWINGDVQPSVSPAFISNHHIALTDVDVFTQMRKGLPADSGFT